MSDDLNTQDAGVLCRRMLQTSICPGDGPGLGRLSVTMLASGRSALYKTVWGRVVLDEASEAAPLLSQCLEL